MAKTKFTVVIFDICVHSSVISCQSCQLQPGQAGGKFPSRGASFIEVRHEADDNHHQVTTTKTTTIPRGVDLSLSFSSKYCILWSSLIIVYPIGMVSCGKSDHLLLHIADIAKWSDRVTSHNSRPSELENSMSTARRRLHTDYVVKKVQVWLRSLSSLSIHPAIHPSVYPFIRLCI